LPGQLCESEVEYLAALTDLGVRVGDHHDVAGLQVAVNNPLRMRRRKGVCQLPADM
jgi:hypothetical protein